MVLAREDVDVTLVTRDPRRDRRDATIHPAVRVMFVPYRTFPLAGRRGTTVLDRSTAYPLFGLKAGGVVLELAKAKQIDIVHGFGARRCRRHPGHARSASRPARRNDSPGCSRDVRAVSNVSAGGPPRYHSPGSEHCVSALRSQGGRCRPRAGEGEADRHRSWFWRAKMSTSPWSRAIRVATGATQRFTRLFA